MAHQLYRHYDASGTLLYVGIALCSVERLVQHRSGAEWFGQIATIRIEHFETEDIAREAEAKAIRKERPIFNKQGYGSYCTQRPCVVALPEAINNYIQQHGLTQEAFGKKIGVTQGLVWQWLKGFTRITPERAVQIERRTAGAITRQELRPDIFE